MNRTYQDYHKRAMQLQYHFHDIVDMRNDPRMQALAHEFHELTNDIASEKNPHHIADRLHVIDHQLMEARSSNVQLMSMGDIQGLHHSVQQFHEDFRRMPDYH